MSTALDRAAAAGYIDDGAFARGLVNRRASGRGAAAIAAELRAKGIARSEVEEALTGLDPEREKLAAARLAERMLAPGADREAAERAAARLLRRGFSPEVAWAAVRGILRG